MRSFASLATLVVLAAGITLHGQGDQARSLYEQAQARQAILRKALDGPRASAATLDSIRTLVTTYEDLARLFPASGYSDNALWEGASLAADAYWHFGEDRDRSRAIRLYEAIGARFPTSSLVRQTAAPLARLTTARPPGAPPARSRAAMPATPPVPPAPVRPAVPPRIDEAPQPVVRAQMTGITRALLPDVLRLSVELEREVPFTVERLDGPPRVFIDFADTRTVDALKDLVLPYDDDVVRQIRVGRQAGARTRVVFDLREPARHSVFTMYDPYRVVIDFTRERRDATGRSASATALPAPGTRDEAPRGPSAPPPLLPSPGRPALLDARSLHPVAAAPDAARPQPLAVGTTPTVPVAATVSPAVPTSNAGGGFSLSRQLGLGATRIAIDPGHGGHDPGAKVKGLTEADLVLSVALKLEALLLAQPGVEVVLTRRTNAFVSLEERTAIANRAGADLFLSIHANASANASAQGIETYYLNFASSDAAQAVAARENAASARSMRELQDIVRAIALNNKMDESRDLARLVQASMHERLREGNRPVRNLGVKQAPFMVLVGATMPSVLAEVSFITNPAEATRLKTEKYRQQIADALFAAITRYRQALKAAPAMAATH